MAESLTGMLRVRSGQVQYRRLNGAQWRDLVPLNTLLTLADEGGTPPGADGLLFRQEMTPDGRDLVGLDGWQDLGAPGSSVAIANSSLQLRTSGPNNYNKPKLYRPLPADVEVRGRARLDIGDSLLVHARATADDLGQATGVYVDGNGGVFAYCFDENGQFTPTPITRDSDGLVPFVIKYQGTTITLNGSAFTTSNVYQGSLGGVSTEGTAKADLVELSFHAVT
jgi:hypothetical protein